MKSINSAVRRRFALLLTALGFTLGVPFTVLAQGYTFGNPIRVSTNDPDNNYYDLAPDLSVQDGGVFVAWSIYDQTGPDDYDVLESFSNDGVNWSTPDFVNIVAEGDTSSESDISGARLTSIVQPFFVYSSNRAVFDGDTCFVKDMNVYRAEGSSPTSWEGSPIAALGVQALTDDYNPVLGGSGSGIFYVWEQRGTATTGFGPDTDLVYVKPFDANTLFPMNLDADSDSSETSQKNDGPPIIAGSGTSFVCVWPSVDSLTSGTERIHARVTTDNGQNWGSEEILFESFETVSGKPSVAMAPDGRIMVVFSTSLALNAEADDDADIVFFTLGSGETEWSAPAYVNTNAETDGLLDEDPAIVVAPNGDWFVGWVTNNQALTGSLDGDRDLAYAVSSDNGATWSTPARLNSDATVDGASANDRDLRLVSANGAIYAAWVASGRAPFNPSINNYTDIWVSRGEAVPANFRSSLRMK